MPVGRTTPPPPSTAVDPNADRVAKATSHSASHRGHTVRHVEHHNTGKLIADLEGRDGRTLLDELDYQEGKSTKTRSAGLRGQPKDPAMRPHIYHKYHEGAGETDNLTRLQKQVRYEGYRLKPEQTLEGQMAAAANRRAAETRAMLSDISDGLDQLQQQAREDEYDIIDMDVISLSDEETTPVHRRTKPTESQTAAASVKPQAEYKAHPALTALATLKLPISEDLSARLQAHQDKLTGYQIDPLATARQDDTAANIERRVLRLDTSSNGPTNAAAMAKASFLNTIDAEAVSLAQETIQELSHDLRFLSFLKTAALTDPKGLNSAQKELLHFLALNIKGFNNHVVADTKDLIRQHAFGKAMSASLEVAKSNAVTQEDKAWLASLEEDLNVYRMDIAKQLALGLNSSNALEKTMDLGRTARTNGMVLQNAHERSQAALSSLRPVVAELVNDKFNATGSIRKTEKWIAEQPWNDLISFTFTKQGNDVVIENSIREEPAAKSIGQSTFFDSTEQLPQLNLTRAEIRDNPTRVFNGLLSPEMREAMTITETGDTFDGLPVVETPSDVSRAWGTALKAAIQKNPALAQQLPDFFHIREVYYHKITGSLIEVDTLEPTWVLEYSPTSQSISTAEAAKEMPINIAWHLANTMTNYTEQQSEREKKQDRIDAIKDRLNAFVQDSGRGLLKVFGKAHDAIVTFRNYVADEITHRIQRHGSNIPKLQAWVAKQSWAPMFDVKFEHPAEAKKNVVNFALDMKKQTPDPAASNAQLSASATAPGDEAEATAVDQDQPQQASVVATLMAPGIKESLIIKELNETAGVIPVVEKPSHLAREWGASLHNQRPAPELPEYLELKQVQYHSEARFIGRGKLKTCWVVEFKPEVFSQQNPKT